MKIDLRNTTKTIEIAGEVFEIEPASEKVFNEVVKLSDWDERFSNIGAGPDDVLEYMETAVEAVENILGEGSVKRIFKDREVDFININHILASILKFLTEEYKSLGKYSPDKIKNA